jgi:hypothetical protein
MKTNLIYFIYVSRINDYHWLNLEMINKYKKVFNGDIIVKIAANCLSINIKKIAEKLPFDYEVVDNNQFGEATHFNSALENVSDGITFYAHAKGVTRRKSEGLEKWIKYLYETNLRKVPEMSEYVFSGTCAKLYPCAPYVPEAFHYAGSFYWFDTNEVKQRIKEKGLNPANIGRYYTERLPALIADKNECQFIGKKYRKKTDLYDIKNW